MPAPIPLSKADARRAMVRHHFSKRATLEEAFAHLRSVQFDPIAPVGCNHDLVLQARVPGYRIGDWEPYAYEARRIYDGWDKMASLVPYEGWPLRRLFWESYRARAERIEKEHPGVMERILGEIAERGPLLPRECEYQERREEWKGLWYGPSVTKQALRALWHTGKVMTSGRRKGQHLYDLTDRVVPEELREQPLLSETDAKRELILERHRAVGVLRPSAPYEVWSYLIYVPERKALLKELVDEGRLVPVHVEGVAAHATPEFLRLLDEPSLDPEVTFVAPLDPFMWDRKMIGHLFDFDYVWEIYTPETKRRWGYYVLPVRFGDALVARAEFFARNGVLELRVWHDEGDPSPAFLTALKPAFDRLMAYAGAERMILDDSIPDVIRACAPTI